MRRTLSLGLLVAAAGTFLLAICPAEAWNQPQVDASYNRFDPNLMFVSGAPGGVRVSPSRVDLLSTPTGSSINLFTTLIPRFKVGINVSPAWDTGPSSSAQLQVGIWSPWTNSGALVLFDSGPQDSIAAEVITDGMPGPTIQGGHASLVDQLGTYPTGSTYHLAFDLDKQQGTLTSALIAPNGRSARWLLSRREFPSLFVNAQYSLFVSMRSPNGTSNVVLTRYQLTIPHQRSWASKIDDGLARAISLALGVLGLVLACVVGSKSRSRIVACLRIWSFKVTGSRLLVWAVIGAVLAYLLGNVALFQLGSHPFDFPNEELYTYVASRYGLADLYYLPNYVSLAQIWGGIPYEESAFPYGPTFAYMYWLLGWVSVHLLGSASLAATQTLYLLKGVNVLFGLADSALIYWILRSVRVERRWSLIAAAFFMFNPAVWFSMSIWGQTHVISLFLALACISLAQTGRPTLAWVALAAAVMTRPQMLVVGFLLGIVLLRLFPIRRSVMSLAWGTVIVSFALLPLTLSISPSLPIDVIVNNFRSQEAGGNTALLSTVSQDAYSVWPMVTYVLNGATSVGRVFTPSADYIFGNVTYQQVGVLVASVAVLAAAAYLAFRPRPHVVAGGYIPVIALGVASFLMLLTGVVATHFVLAIPFLLLSRRWMGTLAYLYVAVTWTVSTLVPMFGDMGASLAGHPEVLLAPQNSPVTRFFVDLYSTDRFITLAIVANICGLGWLAWQTVLPPPTRQSVDL